MNIFEKSFQLLAKYPLCDNCLGRQFAALVRGVENSERGRALKLSLTMQAGTLISEGEKEGVQMLKTLASNGFSFEASDALRHARKRLPKKEKKSTCYLCMDKFGSIESLSMRALKEASRYEYSTFLVGVELPIDVEENEDEFNAAENVTYGESMKHEFGRVLGKIIEKQTGKPAEFRTPDLTIIANPFTEKIRLQVNPLFVVGRYQKLVRDIPQSRWFCSNCRGKGCKECAGTGKLYQESVEEIISKPILEVADGEKTAFHASGREDIDARMLGTGRPFVVEISKPKHRSIDLAKLLESINSAGDGRVKVLRLGFASRDMVRRLKKSESAQKEYRALFDLERDFSDRELKKLEAALTETMVKQRTPLRVVHRRADLTREKYIYKVKVKKVAPKQVEMIVRCQGGLYVKELVSGDQGRTEPSVSGLLGTGAKVSALDVLKVLVKENR